MVFAMGKRVLAVTLPLLFSLAGFFSAVVASGMEYPVQYIGNVELGQLSGHAHIIDCRSRFEYDVLHMENAVHIPVDTMVREDLQRLLIKDPAKAVVFYCNEEDLPKGRAAFLKARSWGYENVFVYRPGIFNWAEVHPEKSVFRGKILAAGSPHQLFSLDHYLKSCLPPDQFILASRQPGTMVVDIRDSAERENFSIVLPNLKYCSLDRLVKLVKSGSRKVTGKKLLILDAYGAQVQWLQYVLDEKGMDYLFLKGGVTAWRQAGHDIYGDTHQGSGQ